MVNEVRQIEQVRYTLYGKPLSKDIVGETDAGEHLASVPFSFLFNSSYKIAHECYNCKQTVSFGLDNEAGSETYKLLKYVCSKYYSNDFLKIFPQIFHATELKEWDGKIYVISNKVFEPDFPVTSSIQPTLYNCPACHADYVARIQVGYPLAPEKNMPEGRLGKIMVDEIIYVKVQNNKHFIDLAEENRIK